MHSLNSSTAIDLGSVADSVLAASCKDAVPTQEYLDRLAALVEHFGWHRSVAGDKDFFGAINAMATSYVRHKGVIFYGSSGVGKTAFFNAACRRTRGTPIFLDMSDPKVAAELDIEKYPSVAEHLCQHNLRIDDLGAETPLTNYGFKRELAGEFICHYYRHGRGRLFITTNLMPENLLARYDQRVFTRIFEMCEDYVFTGDNKRGGKKLKNTADKDSGNDL